MTAIAGAGRLGAGRSTDRASGSRPEGRAAARPTVHKSQLVRSSTRMPASSPSRAEGAVGAPPTSRCSGSCATSRARSARSPATSRHHAAGGLPAPARAPRGSGASSTVHKDGQRRLYVVRPEGLAASSLPAPTLAARSASGSRGRSRATLPAEPLRALDPHRRPARAASSSTSSAPEAMLRWMGDYAVLDARPAASSRSTSTASRCAAATWSRAAPSRLVTRWGHAGSDLLPPGSSTLKAVKLRASEGGTLVEIVHRDLPDIEARKHAAGWRIFLGRLAVAAPAGRV